MSRKPRRAAVAAIAAGAALAATMTATGTAWADGPFPVDQGVGPFGDYTSCMQYREIYLAEGHEVTNCYLAANDRWWFIWAN